MDVAQWSDAPAPRIPVCSGGWCSPKWSLSYSWRIYTSLCTVASTWWPGVCPTSSRLPSPSPSEVHPPRRQMGLSYCAAGGMPPGTPASSQFLPPLGTSLCIWPYGTWNQCSRHACVKHWCTILTEVTDQEVNVTY